MGAPCADATLKAASFFNESPLASEAATAEIWEAPKGSRASLTMARYQTASAAEASVTAIKEYAVACSDAAKTNREIGQFHATESTVPGTRGHQVR